MHRVEPSCRQPLPRQAPSSFCEVRHRRQIRFRHAAFTSFSAPVGSRRQHCIACTPPIDARILSAALHAPPSSSELILRSSASASDQIQARCVHILLRSRRLPSTALHRLHSSNRCAHTISFIACTASSPAADNRSLVKLRAHFAKFGIGVRSPVGIFSDGSVHSGRTS